MPSFFVIDVLMSFLFAISPTSSGYATIIFSPPPPSEVVNDVAAPPHAVAFKSSSTIKGNFLLVFSVDVWYSHVKARRVIHVVG